MYLKQGVTIALCILLAACGGKTYAPVSDRSLGTDSRPSPNQYVVRKGDTLYSIAFRYGLDYRSLAKINGIDKSYSIYPGQRLKLRNLDVVPTGESIVRDASAGGTKVRPSDQVQAKPPIKKQPSAVVTSASQQQVKKAVVSKKVEPKRSSPPQNPQVTATGPIDWRWPASGKVIAHYRTKGTVNKGINISGNKGDPIYAAASGKVVYAGNGLLGYGNLVIIDHNQQFLSAYAHNSRVLVKESDMVKVGQRIAEMGSSGADRVMLHFEIRRDGKPMNPLKFLPKK